MDNNKINGPKETIQRKFVYALESLKECIQQNQYLFAQEKVNGLLSEVAQIIAMANSTSFSCCDIVPAASNMLNAFYSVMLNKHQDSECCVYCKGIYNRFNGITIAGLNNIESLTDDINTLINKTNKYGESYSESLPNKLEAALRRLEDVSDGNIDTNIDTRKIISTDPSFPTRLEQTIASINNAAWAINSDYPKLIKMIVKLAKTLRRFEKRFRTPTLVDDAYLTRVQEFTYGENSRADLLIFNILNSFNFENIFAELSEFKTKNEGLKYQKVIDMLKQLETYLKAQDPENPTISYTEIKSRVKSILMGLKAPWLTKASSLFTASILSISLLSGCAHDNKTASSCENDLPSEPSTTMVNTTEMPTSTIDYSTTMEREQEVTDMFDPQSSIVLYHYRKLKDQDTGDMIFRIMKNTYVTKCSISPIDFYNKYNISEVDEDINIEGDLTKTVHGFKDIASNSEFYIASIEDAKGNILLTENMFYDTYEGIAFGAMTLNIGNKTKYRYSPSWYDINFEIHSASEAFGFDQIPMSDLLEFLSGLTPEDIQDLNESWKEYCSGASLNSKPDKVISFGPCKKNNWN